MTNRESYPSTIEEKAKNWDTALELLNLDEEKPVIPKGWGKIGFRSRKDFAIIRMLSSMERDSKRAYVAEKKIELITEILDRSQDERYFHPDSRYNVIKLVAELREIIERPGIEYIREFLEQAYRTPPTRTDKE